MPAAFFMTSTTGKLPFLDDLIEDFKALDIINRGYGPFKGDFDETAYYFPEHGVRGFFARITQEENRLEFAFGQEILPSLGDWQALLSAMQHMLDNPEFEIVDEERQVLDRDILERWKDQDVYRRRHLLEVRPFLSGWDPAADFLTLSTYLYDLFVEKKDVDLGAPIDDQFDQVQAVLKRQADHYESCAGPEVESQTRDDGTEFEVIAWTPSVPTLLWAADAVRLDDPAFGGSRVVSFEDLLRVLGERARLVGSVTAGRNRFELPAFDFGKPKDLSLKSKIAALNNFAETA